MKAAKSQRRMSSGSAPAASAASTAVITDPAPMMSAWRSFTSPVLRCCQVPSSATGRMATRDVAPALVLGGVSSPVATAFRNTFTRLPPLVLPGTGIQRESHTYPDATPLRPSAETFRFGTRVLREAAAWAPKANELAILMNSSDRTVSNDAIAELVSDWRANGARVREVVLPPSLGLPHDVMDHTQEGAKPAIVDPIVVALATGAPLPSPLPPGTQVSNR